MNRSAACAIALLVLGPACKGTSAGDGRTKEEASAAKMVSKELTVTAGMEKQHKVRVKVDVPDGWSENDFAGITFRSRVFDTMDLDLTCNGMCGDAKTLTENIKQQPREDMDFVKSPNHEPRLEPVWVTETKEEKPGVFYARWDAKDENGKVVERHVRVDRLVPGLEYFLSCSGDVREGATVPIEAIEKACRELVIVD